MAAASALSSAALKMDPLSAPCTAWTAAITLPTITYAPTCKASRSTWEHLDVLQERA